VITLPRNDAEREAARCLDCDLICSTCDSVCPNRAILTYRVRPQEFPVPQFGIVGTQMARLTDVLFRVDQGPQVAVLTDACNECGNCVTFCPTSDRPWRDKPRLYLHRADFEAEADNAFMLIHHDGFRGLHARFGGVLHQLLEGNAVLRYTSPAIELAMDPENLAVLESSVHGPATNGSLVNAEQLGAMFVLHRSFAESMPEYPLIELQQDWSL
jgi:putative selenate reductase